MCQWLMAKFYDKIMHDAEEKGLRDWRRNLLHPIKGDVLELGCGTGVNLEFYPDLIKRLVLIEPNAYMCQQLKDKIIARKQFIEVGMVGMSAITYGELLYRAQKSNNAQKARDTIHQLCDFIPALPISLKVPEFYASIRADLEQKGKMIGNNDLWIAAHCLDLDIILVTNNDKEFSRVTALNIENWVENE